MRKKYLAVFIFASILLCNCVFPSQNKNEIITDATHSALSKDTFHILCQFWKLTDADNPTAKDVSFTNDDSVLFEPGIVFMTDSTILENPTGEMSYGKFKVNGNAINVNFKDGRKAVYLIIRMRKDELRLKRTENKHSTILTYTPTNTIWPDANKNPFSQKNYQWTVKPQKPESDEAIKERVKDCIQFYAYYLKGYIDGNATKIDFRGLPCCFHWYSGGISIQNENKLDRKWANCFYSEDQAFKGRQMIEDIISKKYKWDEKETNWMKQTVPVLLQMRDSL
jgi:hypothetical protein